MFDSDNPVIAFLGKITDIVILNLLFVICSIPIFTIGASITAVYYVTVKMVKNEESYAWRDFLKSFKQNFFQATIIWLINLMTLAIYGVAVLSVTGGDINSLSGASFVGFVVVGIAILAVMAYVYPLLSHFDNTIGNTIKNAILLAIGNLPYTVLFILLMILPVAAYLTPFGLYIIPVILLLGIAGPAYISSFGWKIIFDKLDPKEDQREKNGKKEE